MRIGTLVATPLNTLVALKGGPVKEIADLKGKKVGYSISGFEDALLGTMLQSAGLSLKDVTLVNVNFSLSPALLSKQVDAVIGAFRNVITSYSIHYTKLYDAHNKKSYESNAQFLCCLLRHPHPSPRRTAGGTLAGSPTPAAAMPTARPRLADIDNLRWSVILLVLGVHAAIPYSHLGPWYVYDPRQPSPLETHLFLAFEATSQAFFMGLLFFLAGLFAAPACDPMVSLVGGESATIHDPRPPSRVALSLSECEEGGVVEVARRNNFV